MKMYQVTIRIVREITVTTQAADDDEAVEKITRRITGKSMTVRRGDLEPFPTIYHLKKKR